MYLSAFLRWMFSLSHKSMHCLVLVPETLFCMRLKSQISRKEILDLNLEKIRWMEGRDQLQTNQQKERDLVSRVWKVNLVTLVWPLGNLPLATICLSFSSRAIFSRRFTACIQLGCTTPTRAHTSRLMITFAIALWVTSNLLINCFTWHHLQKTLPNAQQAQGIEYFDSLNNISTKQQQRFEDWEMRVSIWTNQCINVDKSM